MAVKVKGIRVCFAISICSNIIAVAISLLNLEELEDIKYGMEISGTPVLLRENPLLSNTLLLSSKHGQQYQCTLPLIEKDEFIKQENENYTTEEITSLLQPLENKCLYHNNGWWTYEVCFGKNISQYHEEGNSLKGDRISLGLYSSQTDWSKEKVEKSKSKTTVVQRYHSQYYVNGTVCDLSQNPRNTQVKFSCEVDKNDYIYRVDEPSSCSYVVDIHTSRLCKHPLFRPPPVSKPKSIKCSPALSKERYDTYLATIEIQKKALEAKQRARAKRLEEASEEDDIELGYRALPKHKPLRSQLWPWESPGVEDDDEMWISGKIDKEQIDVNRMDLFKGRKKLNDKESDESILTMRNIFTKKDRTTKPKPSPSVGSADKEKSEKMSSPGDTTVKKREESQASPDKQSEEPPQSPGDTTVNKPEESQARPDKTSEESDDQLHSDDPKADETKDDPSNESSKDESKDNIHEKKTLEQEWRDALAKARQNLRTVVRKQLQDMGVDPDDLEKKFKTMMSKHGLGAQKNPNEESNGPSTVNQETSEADLVKESNQNIPETQEARGAEGNEKDDPIISKASLTKEAEKAEAKPEPKSKLHVDHPDGPAIASTNSPADKSDSSPDMVGLKAALNNKLEKLAREVDDMEKDGRLKKDSRERKMLLNIKKLITGMDRQNMLLMKKEETLRRALEKHLDELSDRFNMEATMMKRFMDDIDDGLEGDDDYLKDVVERLKRAMHSFDEASRSLSTDMAAVKNLNQEIHSKLDNIIRKTEPTGDQGRKFFRLAAKANLLLRRLLQRSAQLDKEMRIIREISKEADTRRQEYLDNEVADDLIPGKELEGEAKVKMNNIVERLKNMIKDIDTGRQGKMGDPLDPLGMENIKVRVTKIKGENGQPVWSENDEDADETAIESRLRMATKRMERIVKEQLRDAGVAPAGKIRVKIITSKEALENMGGDKGMQILSDEETSEFKKMVLNLLGGNQDAVEERKNHMALENNYNLVWDENHLSKAPSEDDDEESEAELTFDDTPF